MESLKDKFSGIHPERLVRIIRDSSNTENSINTRNTTRKNKDDVVYRGKKVYSKKSHTNVASETNTTDTKKSKPTKTDKKSKNTTNKTKKSKESNYTTNSEQKGENEQKVENEQKGDNEQKGENEQKGDNEQNNIIEMNSKKLSELLFKKKFVSNETQDESKRHEDSDDKSQESEKKKIKVKQEINNMVLTIDVGLKNLAMCIMDSHYNIHLWDVYNMLDAEQYSYSCGTRQKDGKMCEKKCQFKFPKEIKNKIVNETVDENTSEIIKKVDISTEIVYTCKRHFPKDMPNQKKYFIKEKKVGDYLLQDITERIMKGIQDIYDKHVDLFIKVTNICIELQPKVNQRMKFTSHIIYAKFVDLYKNRDGEIPVRFIRASQNLQAYRGPPVECKLKTPYAKRKYLSVAYTKWYLEHDLLNNDFNKSRNYIEFLLSHPKKDDLCDVSNANINVHKGLKKKQKQNKNGSEIK